METEEVLREVITSMRAQNQKLDVMNERSIRTEEAVKHSIDKLDDLSHTLDEHKHRIRTMERINATLHGTWAAVVMLGIVFKQKIVALFA